MSDPLSPGFEAEKRRRRAAPAPLLLGLVGLLVACAVGEPERDDAFYGPTEDVLEVVAVLRLHIDDDTYRFPPARDFTGKNVYRTSLARLERLEQIYAEKFRAGYMTDVLLFAKGRALERIVEYELAAAHYERVAELDSPLAELASRAAAICRRIAEARAIAPWPEASREDAFEMFDAQALRLQALLEDVQDEHYAYVVREEVERADQARAAYFDARRRLDPALEVIALQQYQQLVQTHSESKIRNRHLLDLADLYAALSRAYVQRQPPASLDFDAATFDEYAYGASRLYEAVSLEDGAIEKVEASRKLEAFLAFTLQVYDEKLPD